MNVAVHLNNLGVDAAMISRVGKDELGRELISFLNSKNVPTHLIQQDGEYPTGVVNVSLDEQGQASYEIIQPVAWDFITAEEEVISAAKAADVLVFGSLANRSKATRETLQQLLQLPLTKVFDVNLRAPFYDRQLIQSLLASAQIVKMNDEELEEISDWYGIEGKMGQQMEHLMRSFAIDHLLVTRGADGAVYRHSRGFVAHPGYRVKVQDTVGSGDTFFATFLSQWKRGESPEACLQYACAAGALVASLPGGTPKIDRNLIRQFIEEKDSGSQYTNQF